MAQTGSPPPIGSRISWVAALGLVIVLFIIKLQFVPWRPKPLGLDPCDAVNAFALISIFVIVVGSPVCSGIAHLTRKKTASRLMSQPRAQQGIVLSVWLLLCAEFIALARHTSLWIEKPWHARFMILLCVQAGATLVAQVVVSNARRNSTGAAAVGWKRLASMALAIVAVLAVCPEWPFDYGGQAAHVLTVALGAAVVFVPMRLLIPALAPAGASGRPLPGRAVELLILAAGIAIIGLGFRFHLKPALVAFGGVLIAFAFLREPLGWTRMAERES